MLIEVFADIWCPFAHVGLRAVAEERARLGRHDVTLVVRAWPLELVNGAPMDPHKAAHHADDLRAQVAPDMFGRLDEATFPTSTLEALALTARAYRSGALAGERMAFALRDALFERGLDIGDPTVLAVLAVEHGVTMPDDTDRAAVLADHAEGQARGVVGSPHFFCGSRGLFCPSLSITRDDVGALSIAADRRRLVDFLDECLGSTAGAAS